mgnify:FL=1
MLVSLVSSQGVFPVVGGITLVAREALDLHLLLLGVGVLYLYFILLAVVIEGVKVNLVHLLEVLPQLAHVVKLGAADLAPLLLLLLLDVHLGLQGGAVNRDVMAVLLSEAGVSSAAAKTASETGENGCK